MSRAARPTPEPHADEVSEDDFAAALAAYQARQPVAEELIERMNDDQVERFYAVVKAAEAAGTHRQAEAAAPEAPTPNREHVEPDTGEVAALDAPGRKPRRTKRELTPEEKAVVEERAAQKRAMFAALESLSPALPAEGETVRDAGLIDVSRAAPSPPLLRIERKSGRGNVGSALALYLRPYDGHNGGEATDYVLACAEFHDGKGYKCRTRGVAIRRPELRDVAAALTAEADRLDGAEPEAARPSRARRKRPRGRHDARERPPTGATGE